MPVSIILMSPQIKDRETGETHYVREAWTDGEFVKTSGGGIYHGRNVDVLPDCFIATVVYGNADAPEVNALRRFRDEELKDHAVGRLFIDAYYSGAGRRAADFLRDYLSPTIPLLKKGLDLIAKRYAVD